MHARPLLQELLQVFDRQVGYSRVFLEKNVVGSAALHFAMILCSALLLSELYLSRAWFYVFLALKPQLIALKVLIGSVLKF